MKNNHVWTIAKGMDQLDCILEQGLWPYICHGGGVETVAGYGGNGAQWVGTHMVDDHKLSTPHPKPTPEVLHNKHIVTTRISTTLLSNFHVDFISSINRTFNLEPWGLDIGGKGVRGLGI